MEVPFEASLAQTNHSSTSRVNIDQGQKKLYSPPSGHLWVPHVPHAMYSLMLVMVSAVKKQRRVDALLSSLSPFPLSQETQSTERDTLHLWLVYTIHPT